MRREEILELLAKVWLLFSFIGGIYIGYVGGANFGSSIGIVIALAVIIQGTVLSYFLLVVADLASTASMLYDKAKSIDSKLNRIGIGKELINKAERDSKATMYKSPNETEYVKAPQKVDDDFDNGAIASNIALVSLRSGAGEIYSIVGKVQKGTLLTVIERQSEWIQVKTKEGIIGWLKDVYVYKI